MDEIKATFFEECSELLEQLEAGLLALQSGQQNADTVDAVFRAVHSIKGGAGAFDLGDLVTFAHGFETVLDGLRTGRLEPTSDVTATLLRASDRLGDLVSLSRDGTSQGCDLPPDLVALAASLDQTEDPTLQEESFGLEPVFQPIPLDLGMPEANDANDFELFEGAGLPQQSHLAPREHTGTWVITFDPLPDLLDSGNEPLFLFRALEVLGQIKVSARDDDLACLEDMELNVARLRWRILLIPSAQDLTETEIESVFEFASDLCVLTIHRATEETVAPECDWPAPSPEAPSAMSETRPDPTMRDTGGALASAPPVPESIPKPAFSSTIRVDLERIDRLVNLVGELVITQSMLAQSIQRDSLDTHSQSVSELDDLQQLTRDIQDSVMAIRAQPVRSLFQRMTRIVREAAQMTGKDVQLETEGDATEIDKTVVERLADPLTHMIRNAIDHGLEGADERIAAGKGPTGRIRLSARQQSDRVIIEVSDDGRGINRSRVLARAMERNLVNQTSELSPGEIDRLLFLPGFSTTDGVSAISGRGVGMDVVQRSIRDLNGTISIASEDGQGCTLSISLPLTLAILDGMIVRTSEQRMVIPLSAIVETQTVSTARIQSLGSDRRVVKLHDRFVPIVNLAMGMGFDHPMVEGNGQLSEDSALLFVKADDLAPFAVQVDAIEAQRQVVIKGLGDSVGRVPCVSAATILGDGQVALIVDPSGLATTNGLGTGQSISTPEMRLQ
ncbi:MULTISPECIES: chemotaxis protein CheA [Jannaschia]|nr:MULTISPECIES: chemotaxis protein CheA [unclassified Jannaschia]